MGIMIDDVLYSLNMSDFLSTTEQFVSIKKISCFYGKQEYQEVTIKHEHWKKFCEWILKEIATERDEDGKVSRGARSKSRSTDR